MKKVLFFNPPSKRFSYTRDYFCSKVVKGNYIEHPVDFLMLSGILSESCQVNILDATVLGLDSRKSLKEIKDLSPDFIIFISGLASWIEDFDLMRQVKAINHNVKLIGLGDIFRTGEMLIDNNWLDAVLFDFTTKDILNYFNGNNERVKNMTFRDNGNIVRREVVKYNNEEFEIPIPRHEMFLKKRYTFPFARKLPFVTILTDYGCPFSCSFCIYNTLGSKIRKLDNVFFELEYVKHLGVRELFIKDQTFGYNKERTFRLCQEIIKRKWNFSWTAFSRPDILDFDFLSAMKDSGCHTLILGAETANDELLNRSKKGFSKEVVERAFALCRHLKIRTVGTFMIGFPYEPKVSMLNTIDFALKLNCDFASFNAFTPKADYAREFLASKTNRKVDDKQWDQSGVTSVFGNVAVSKEDISDLLSVAIRRFYFRPFYILRRILNIKSVDEIKMLIVNGMGLIKNFINQRLLKYKTGEAVET